MRNRGQGHHLTVGSGHVDVTHLFTVKSVLALNQGNDLLTATIHIEPVDEVAPGRDSKICPHLRQIQSEGSELVPVEHNRCLWLIEFHINGWREGKQPALFRLFLDRPGKFQQTLRIGRLCN
jgi:hypothetical protein